MIFERPGKNRPFDGYWQGKLSEHNFQRTRWRGTGPYLSQDLDGGVSHFLIASMAIDR